MDSDDCTTINEITYSLIDVQPSFSGQKIALNRIARHFVHSFL